MKKSVKVSVLVGLLGVTLVLGLAMTASANRGDGALGVVYVYGQGLYYDTFVSATVLPNRGPFQKLEPGGATEYGPGDRGYVGGRWWIDDGDGVRGDEDTFLLCPLLGPGRLLP